MQALADTSVWRSSVLLMPASDLHMTVTGQTKTQLIQLGVCCSHA